MNSTNRGRNTLRQYVRRAVVSLVLAAGTLTSACSVGVDVDDGGVTDLPISSTDVAATEALATVLAQALAQEQMAKASYDDVITRLGPVEPFVEIAKDEAESLSSLQDVARAHGITISDDPLPGSPAAPDRASACMVAGEIEKSGIELYDQLLPRVAAFPDVSEVLSRLRSSAEEAHLPAFQRCA